MSALADEKACPAQPPRLFGQRAIHELLVDIEAGAGRLATLTAGWASNPPMPCQLVDAVTTVEGLRRLLAESRQQAGRGAPDAA